MELEKVIHIEESLLLCENENKFNMPFADYITLDSMLSYIENITDLYFQLVNDYQKQISKEAISSTEKYEKITSFNNDLLKEDIELNLTSYQSFMEKYNIIK
jgi:hypothetical protein